MSISISWRLVKPQSWTSLPGTSSDWAIFERTFGHRALNYGDVEKLTVMHYVAGYEKTLWGALADALNSLPEGSEIEVKGEY